MNNNKLQILFISLLLVLTAFSQINAADILSGRVYEGDTGIEPPISTPLAGVTVQLYASNNAGVLGPQIGSTTTDSQGWYGLTATAGYEYYTIVEVDLSGYHSVGATSVDGTVINNNRIRYSTATAPLSDQTLTGNKFWDKPDAPSNNPPLADANGPYTGKVGQAVTLDGSGSYDPDPGDSIVSYEWDIDYDGQYDDATGVTVHHTWYSTHNGFIGLQVTDSFGETDTDSTRITITEDEQLGNITIIKAATPPDSGVIFSFTGDLGNFTLTPTSNQRSFNNLSPGVYTITENVPSGWFLGNYQISGDLDGGTTHDSLNARFSIDLDAGEDISLVIYNYKGGNITIKKQTVPETSQQIFNFHGSLGAMALANGYSATQYNLQPGLYIVTEDTVAGWILSDIIINDTNSSADLANRTASIFLEAGESVSATFINVAEGESRLDFGDAPDPTYPTLLSNNGARHTIIDGIHMGASIDSEQDGQQDASALGDDGDGNDDEDGIVFQNDLIPGAFTSFVATVSVNGNLGVWVDFNGNGNWADPGESIFNHDTTVFAGANTWGFLIPPNAQPGRTVARFRYSTTPGLNYNGAWADGEVEDYLVEIKGETELGFITIKKQAQPADNTPFDFTGDFGSFNLKYPSDSTITFAGVNPGRYSFQENIPSGWRLNQINVNDPNGGSSVDVAAATAYVQVDANEHILVTFINSKEGEGDLDFGDAPDPTYPTLLVNNGARHIIDPDIFLGSGVESDPDGQPDAGAQGDDNDGNDDEDGVVFTAPLVPGTIGTVTITASVDGYLSGWIDFDRDGDWDMASDYIFSRFAATAGTRDYYFNIPANAVPGATFARIRFTTVDSPVVYVDGLVGNGEVEDYQVEIAEGGQNASIGDRVWHDLDQDGLQDAGESGLDSVQVSLFDQNGNLLAMTMTNFTGFYMFSNVTPGSYFIRFSLRYGFTYSPADQGMDDTIDSDAQPGLGDTQLFTLAAGVHNPDMDAGMYRSEGSCEIRGKKWNDLNGNGLRDTGEPGLANWQIILDYNQDGVLDPSPGSGDWIVMTNSNGDYIFTGHFSGSYAVGEILQTDWQQTFPQSTNSAHLGYVAPYDHLVTLSPNQIVTDIDFGNIRRDEQDDLDFGDAPDSPESPGYPTLLVNNGARHFIKRGFHLGAAIDADPNGHPSMLSDGDDLNPATGPDDEDGVTMSPFIAAGQSVPITVVASDTGVLNAWLDFNINGNWADAGEHFIPAMPVYPGANSFTLNVPAGIAPGLTYARFRFSSVRQLSYDGLAPDGEVEDYAIEIKEPQDGSIIIIKDATPKDNTQFLICQQLSSSFFNMLCVFLQDPLNNKMTILNPSDVISISEAMIPGWSLQDITVTGDIDHGSTINVASGRVDVDYDPGENIIITFKNERVGNEELFDLGDAPDGTNHSGLSMDAYPGVPAHFPTVHDPATGLPQGPLHIQPRAQAYLGHRVSLEIDADIGADEDPTNNIVPQNNRPDQDYYDDGVTLPLILPDCGITSFDYRVTVAPSATNQNFYVNVWFDWNRDGDWKDKVTCSSGTAPEWAVQNQQITLSPGFHTVSTPSFLSTHPAFTGTPAPIWMRIMITTLASDTDDGSGPANGYPFGETEDYYFVPRISGDVHYDFGDAPDNADTPGYPTLHANGGAYHVGTDGFHLGGLIDGEIDGQPTPDAMGDDNTNMDDEDGVTFSTPLVPGQPAVVEVVASAQGVLNAWIDYNVNSSWMDSDEHIFIDVPVNAGNNPLTFNVPTTAVPGPTFARFRLSRIAGLLSTGYGHAGEVEDYEVGIVEDGEGPPLKWRQIPLKNKDPEMSYTPYYMGWDVPSLYDGTFIADDWFCKSPRPVTSIMWVGSYTDWDSAFPPPIAPHAFHLGVWTDVPKGEDTDWSHPGEMIWEWTVPRELLDERVQGKDFHPEYMSRPDTCFRYDFIIPEDEWFRQESDSMIYWLSIAALYEEVPDSFVWGWTTRYHYFHDDAVYVYEPVTPTVGAVAVKTEPINEGWDMSFMLGTDEHFLEFDFGDAPSERYPTFFGQNGALHIYNPKVYLGQHIDTEITGQPDHTATGDDNSGIDDEDGITFTAPIEAGHTSTVEIMASRTGYLNAWMDFNNNGSWADDGEQIFRDELIPSGQSYLPVPIPEDAVPPPVFSRFRFSTEPGLYFVGLAIDGEVEDYYANYIFEDVEASENDGTIPTEFKLMQNFPNPFNPATEIRYDIPKSVFVRLALYNLSGQEIAILVSEQKSPGSYIARWNGRNKQGQQVAAGIYLYRIKAGNFRGTGKLLLLK